MNLVSIVVPVFNTSLYLNQCIESILSQSYTNFELFLVDDGSTDSSLDICKLYENIDKRITVIAKKNEGLAKAREIGLMASKGNFFVTIDSDDFVEKDYLEKLLVSLKTNNTDIALCAKKVVFKQNNAIVNIPKNASKVIRVTDEMLNRDYSSICRVYQMSDSWNKMYKMSFLKDSNAHFDMPREFNGTDLLFNYLLVLACPSISCVDEPLYNYRIVETSRVRKKNKHLEIAFGYILDRIVQQLRIREKPQEQYIQAYSSYISMIKYASLDLYNEVRKKAKKEIKNEFSVFFEHVVKFDELTKKLILKTVETKMRIFTKIVFRKSVRQILIYYKLRSLVKRV